MVLAVDSPAPAIGTDEVRQAMERLRPWVHRTPVLQSRTLNARTGASVLLKCENFQRIGAFKFRGAMNALLQLNDAERTAGVVTHSSGNHAQAVALAGQLLGIPVCVVMPRTAPPVKRAATEGYGARVVPCEPTLAARESTVAEQIERHGLTLIHPYDDWRVIAGQATAAWELIEDAGPLDLVLTPVGGGGLLSGTALAVQALAPGTRVIGVEPEQADDARRSLQQGVIQPSNDPKTIADGLRTSLGPRPFSVIRRHVETIVTATEAEIIETMRFVWERFKIVVEPSGAVPIAPIFTGRLPVRDLKAGVIVSGGNVDLEPFFQSLAAQWL
jgi:threonine dehydratase